MSRVPVSPLLPSLESELRRLISQYGKDAVLKAVKEQTKSRRGAKPQADWSFLLTVYQQDAEHWLEGRDPVKIRTSYAIAKERSNGEVATMKRLLRKLKERRFWTALIAYRDSAKRFHAIHIRTLEALSEHDERWAEPLNWAQQELQLYRQEHGKAPPAEMTYEEIQEAVRQSRALKALKGVGSNAPLPRLMG